VLVEYRRHHKHSASIIRHATLPGLDAERTAVLACVARYHRRAMPSPRHAEFAALSHGAKLLVQCLAAILRVADGLDHDHTQRVRVAGVGLSRVPDQRVLRVRVRARGTVGECVEAAESKGDLFAEVFDLEPVVEVG
jgi:exopolyphosphatase/guanosine-5'-triphosphate,3'-diphosphate pyrophosphatase